VKVGALILGAGRSSRMGRPKLLLPWKDTTVIGQLLRHWRALEASQISVVFGQGDEMLQRELDGLNCSAGDRVINPTPERGMFSSIQCAAQWPGWNQSLTHWALILGDQPHLRLETLRRLLDFARENPEKVCQPKYGGHRRHPLIFPKALFFSLARTQAADLNEFLDSVPAAYCALEDAGLALDIDFPQDYDKARALA
jgi:molybdenum cofactor cytidylyltransferase